MNKEDLLRKARAENKDEREKEIEVSSFRAGWIGVSLIMLILIGLRWYFNESGTDIVMILLAQQSAGLFYQYVKLKNKKYLIAGLFTVAGILLGFASLLSNYGVF